MRLIRERARIFHLNVFKIPRFVFMPLWFEPDHSEKFHWKPHELLIRERAKLKDFYSRMKEKAKNETVSSPSVYQGYMPEMKSENNFRTFSAPFRSHSQYKGGIDLQEAINRLLIDGVNRYRLG